jgi:hypothetical protein
MLALQVQGPEFKPQHWKKEGKEKKKNFPPKEEKWQYQANMIFELTPSCQQVAVIQTAAFFVQYFYKFCTPASSVSASWERELRPHKVDPDASSYFCPSRDQSRRRASQTPGKSDNHWYRTCLLAFCPGFQYP